MYFFRNFDQPLGNLLCTSLGMMQLQLEESVFRAAGKCGWSEPQEPVMSVRHSDGSAPHKRDVSLVHAVNTEMQLHCRYVCLA